MSMYRGLQIVSRRATAKDNKGLNERQERTRRRPYTGDRRKVKVEGK